MAATATVTNLITGYTPVIATVRAAQIVTEVDSITNVATSYAPVVVTNPVNQVVTQTNTITNVVTSFTPVVVTNVVTQTLNQVDTITNAVTVTATQLATVVNTITATASLNVPIAGPQKRQLPSFFQSLVADILGRLGQAAPSNTVASATFAVGATVSINKAVGVPTYAVSACANTQRYASACSCRGIPSVVVTASVRNLAAAVTNIVTITPTSTVGASTTVTVTSTTVLPSTTTTTITDLSTSTILQNVALATVIPVTSTVAVTNLFTSTVLQTVLSTINLPVYTTTLITTTVAINAQATAFITATATVQQTVTTSTTATVATIQPTIGPFFLLFNGGINDGSSLALADLLGLNTGFVLEPNMNAMSNFVIDKSGNVYINDVINNSPAGTYYLAVSGTPVDPVIVDNIATDLTRTKITCAVANPTGLNAQTDSYGDINLGRFSCVGPAGESVFVQCADALYLNAPGNVGVGCQVVNLDAWLY